MKKEYKEQLIHVTLITRAANGIWYICAELFSKNVYHVKLVSSMVIPLQEVNHLVRKGPAPMNKVLTINPISRITLIRSGTCI